MLIKFNKIQPTVNMRSKGIIKVLILAATHNTKKDNKNL